MIKFEQYSFKGNDCSGVFTYDIARDCWTIKFDIPVSGFKSSDHAGKAIKEAIDSFDLKLGQFKQAESNRKHNFRSLDANDRDEILEDAKKLIGKMLTFSLHGSFERVDRHIVRDACDQWLKKYGGEK